MILSRQLGAKARPTVRSLVEYLQANSLLRNSIYIMTTTALTASSGYIFWIIAARMYPAADVGLASALIGTMTLAATMANLGIGPTLIQTLPRKESGEPWSLALNAVFLTGILTSLLTGSIAAIALPILSPRLTVVGQESGFTLALVAGVPLLSLAALLDSTFTAERVAGKTLTRTAVFALMRIPLLVAPVLLGHAGAITICIAWALAAGISVVTGALLIRRLNRSYRLARRGIFAQMRSTFSMIAGHQLISFGALAPIYLLPLIVVTRLSLAENAYFYTSWQVGSLFFMVSPSVAISLLAEGSHTPAEIIRKAKSSVLIISGLLCPPMLIAVLGGHLILSMFGAKYSLYGYSLLIVLVLSAVPDALTNVYVAVLRVQKRYARAAMLNIGMGALTVTLAWVLLPRLGIVGAGWAWLIAQSSGTAVVVGHALIVYSRSHADEWRRFLAPVFERASAVVVGVREMGADFKAYVGGQGRPRTASQPGARILVIADPCSAGESLRIAPFVAMVRQGYPQAFITLVANADALKGLERIEEVDRIVRSDLYLYRPYSPVVTRLLQIWTWLGLVRQLGIGYDLVMTFYWGGVLQHALGYVVSRGRRVGYAHYPALLSRWLLTTNLGPFKWKESHPPQHQALLRAVGVEPAATTKPFMNYTGEDVAAVKRLLQARGIADGTRLITLHPGSDWACQQWLWERWSELADSLVARYNATVIFTGVASEAGYVEDIQKGMKSPAFSFVGETTLPQMAALLAHSDLCVCVDSAVFELTQAVGIPAVVLAGPSRPDTGVFGTFQPTIVRRMGDTLASMASACQKEHNARHEPGCWNYQCLMSGLRDITVADALEAADNQLRHGVPRQQAERDTDMRVEDIPAPHPALVELFSVFTQQNIRWLLLRGETELASPAGDVDLLIDPQDMPRAREILMESRYLYLPTYGRGSHRFFVGYHAATQTWITLDIVTEMTYGRYLNLRSHAATGCLTRRERLGSLYVFAPDDRFWALFLHCMLDKGSFAPHRAVRLRELAPMARLNGPLARQVALACPDGWDPAQLVERVTLGDWEALTHLAPILRAGWRRREPIKAWWWAMKNFALQLLEIPLARLQRPGISVALMGPDGAGKSTLTAEIRRSFHVPVRAVYMGLWKSGKKEPDAKQPLPGLWIAKRGIEILGRLPKAWGRYFVATYYQALGRVVIFDRYVYDALVSAHHSAGRLKRLYMWVLGHSCPAPDLVLVLDAPGEVMYARKGEHTPEELEAQRQGLLALRDSVPHVQIVDATRDEAEVRADVLDRIWREYSRRWNGTKSA
jgi:ADP-heptose:LPS heptosyltransferase/O-antigen/teichoic acid export membrane protein/thymidylate kinase